MKSSENMRNLKIALVHDWVTTMGGAERVLLALAELYPKAPIYAIVANQAKLPLPLAQRKIYTSFIQRLPLSTRKYQAYLPLMPLAVEQFDLTGYDIVISSSHACAKGVITRSDTLHICYCHTPMRYAWEFYHEYLEREQVGRLGRLLIAPLMNRLRMWDYLSAQRVDYFIANSSAVAARIAKHYRRQAEVIHPPVETEFFLPRPGEEVPAEGEFYLVVSRLVGYKRIDLAVEAFNRLGLPLVVIGDGPRRRDLEKMAKPNITFLGRQSDETVREYFLRCRGFIFPGEEDFGLTPVEAQAAGRPVVAYGRGGVLDSVVDGETGVLFREQSVEALMEAVRRAELLRFDPERIRAQARRFDKKVFQDKILNFIQARLAAGPIKNEVAKRDGEEDRP